MSISGLTASSAQVGDIESKGVPDSKSVSAAQQFETLLLAQMLKSMRGSGGWLGTGEDKAGDSAIGMAEEHLASALTASGGFGIARLIQSSLVNENQKLQD